MNITETPFYKQLIEFISPEQIDFDEPLNSHTTFKVGGPASVYVRVQNAEQLSRIIRYFNLIDKDYYILGNGSNVLVGDKGYSGVILSLVRDMKDIKIQGDRVICGAGALLSSVARLVADSGLTGLEFAAGIPGTIGGAVVMNAGAYGGEMKQVIESIEAITDDGAILSMVNDELELGYRTSIFKKKKLACSQVVLKLENGDKSAIKSKMDELAALRREKQPLEYPSAGSTFKRPEGYFAGKLIMDANLRGYQIGGARVSDKHCGFIVNVGDATAADILDLIQEVREKVKRIHGVDLEPEVCMLGEF